MTTLIGTIDGCDIVEQDDKSVTFTAAAQLDGDGANGQFGQPPCYAPESFTGKTLDVLASAGRPGNWFGVVTDTGKKDGTPVVQGAQDPCPGAYVSATSLHLPGPDGKPLRDSSPFSSTSIRQPCPSSSCLTWSSPESRVSCWAAVSW